MSKTVFNNLCKSVQKGARVSIGRNYYGEIKLRVYRGPFGLFRKTVRLSNAELQLLFSTVKLRSVTA